MSREILFKGKRVDNNQWTEGFLSFIYTDGRNSNGFIYTDKAQIYSPVEVRSHDVYTSTVGQFTGLYDKDGKKIFEGDILMSSRWSCPCHVSFMDGGFTLEEGETAENLGANFYDCEGDEIEDIQVIGNIHDTPNLAKEEAE